MENKINWAQKLSSRKLWAAIIGVVVGVAAAFGIDGNEYAEVAGVITSLVSVVSYIFAESGVDKARENAKMPLNIHIPEFGETEASEEAEATEGETVQ